MSRKWSWITALLLVLAIHLWRIEQYGPAVQLLIAVLIPIERENRRSGPPVSHE